MSYLCVLDRLAHAWLVQVRVKQHTDNVAGVKIPKFDFVKESGDAKMDVTGLSAGGMQLSKCKDAYSKTVELLVNLASLQSAFLTLDVAIKTTNRRVNALDNVVKPRIANTISYIKVWPPVPCSQLWHAAHPVALVWRACSLNVAPKPQKQMWICLYCKSSAPGLRMRHPANTSACVC
jgi:hypothetical protein